jgi:hypothetical protein
MRTINTLLVVFLSILIISCTATEEVAEDQRVERSYPKSVGVVLVDVADLDKSIVKNVEGLDRPDELYIRYLKDALAAKRPDWRVEIRGPESATIQHDVLIKNELLLIDGGSAAMRFWIGLGTGAIVSKVDVKILDAQDRLIAESDIAQKTTCPMGACTDEQTPAVKENIKELAYSVADYIYKISKQ